MPLPFAAAVFVTNEDKKILATKRADGKGYGLPCGKMEPNELPHWTAVRECFEETGNVVVVQTDRTAPYEAEDDSGHLVVTYRAYIVATGKPTHPEEGETVWITAKQLTEESGWNEYNKGVLEHFKWRGK